MEERIGFYNKILNLSNQSKRINDLDNNINELVSFMISNYREAAHIAALNSHQKCYIFIYNTKALYKGELLNNYVFAPSEMTNIYKSKKILDLPSRLTELLFPFEVLYETHSCNTDEYVCIAIKW
jgi:hypothetical protein